MNGELRKASDMSSTAITVRSIACSISEEDFRLQDLQVSDEAVFPRLVLMAVAEENRGRSGLGLGGI
jgi:hypothetical protein